MPEMIYLVGLPASGKSTYIKKYLKNYSIISNDAIVDEYALLYCLDYNEAWKRISFSYVRNECKKRFNEAINKKLNIVIDNTNLTVKSRRKYDVKGYDKKCVIFCLSNNELEKRTSKRKDETGKLVPENVIKDMIKNFIYPTKEEGFSEIKEIRN